MMIMLMMMMIIKSENVGNGTRLKLPKLTWCFMMMDKVNNGKAKLIVEWKVEK